MLLRFPLSDVTIELSTKAKVVENPLYEDGYYRLNQDEFSMQVAEIGSFYASGGDYVRVVPDPGVSEESLEVYLNGSTYGAILHQRKIMPLHGSCFIYNDLGIMLCGESGAGKSSLTAAFCQQEGHFLTDDVSPVVFREGLPFILPMSDRIKLWDDSLQQLQLEKEHLAEIWKGYQKYYLPMESEEKEVYPLNLILILEKHQGDQVEFEEVKGVERFEALRNEIYRWEYLKGMPDSEAHYLKQLLGISARVPVFKVRRPEVIQITSMKILLEEFIKENISDLEGEKIH